MIRTFALVGCAIAVAALWVGAPAQAATVAKMDLPALVDAADAIVIGRPRSAEAVWVNGELYTRYRVEVEESLLGSAGGDIAVVVPGGVDRKRRVPIAAVVEGAPTLRRDARTALFVVQSHFPVGGDFAIAGFNQGIVELDGAARAPRAPEGAAQRSASSAQSSSDSGVRALRARLQPLIATRGRRASPPDARRDRPTAPEVAGGVR
jgi:hypothetical protein